MGDYALGDPPIFAKVGRFALKADPRKRNPVDNIQNNSIYNSYSPDPNEATNVKLSRCWDLSRSRLLDVPYYVAILSRWVLVLDVVGGDVIFRKAIKLGT